MLYYIDKQNKRKRKQIFENRKQIKLLLLNATRSQNDDDRAPSEPTEYIFCLSKPFTLDLI